MRENWKIGKLGDLAEKITKGGTPTTYGFSFQKKGINFLKVENIQNGSINLASISDFISIDAHEFQSKSQLLSGDILFSIAGTIGVTCIVEEKHLPANTNQALAIIKGTNNAMLPKLLVWQLEYFVQKIKLKARGGAMNNVSLEDLKNLDIQIPPLAEQHRIVAKIEELFSALDKGIESLKTAQQQLKVYRQAVLKYAFEGKLTNPEVKEGELPEGWEVRKLENLGNLICGQSPSVSEVNKDKKGILYVTGPEQWNGKHIEETKWTEYPKRIAPEGCIFITVKGAGVGKLFPGKECAIGRDIYAFKPNGNVDFKCIFYALKYSIDIVVSKAQGDIPGLNKNHILDHYITIGTISNQIQVVQEIESRLSVCDKIEESIAQSLQQAEALRQSILRKAFEGRLVPQDPNDEPASVLLERIRAARAAAQPVQKNRTKKAKA